MKETSVTWSMDYVVIDYSNGAIFMKAKQPWHLVFPARKGI